MEKKYKHFGIMLDCSRNAVMKPSEIKKFIDLMVKMGYDTLQLYAEDVYEVKDEPYVGYLRGRYTGEELKDIDAYAKSKGVELIPCIQTLAHFSAMSRWGNEFSDIFDLFDILLIDEENTYEFIDRLFASCAENFTSRHINIGMDEAFLVGRGRYLDRHGYKNHFEILLRHLGRVVEIAKKYGFTPHMWSDMFFCLANNGAYYVKGARIPEEVRKLVPEEVGLAYWDYARKEEEGYDDMFTAHEDFNRPIWYAGEIRMWKGYAPYNEFSLCTMKAAMKQVIKHGVENVLITLWGGDGAECSFYSTLPGLYAVRQYANGIFDRAEIEKGFKELFGYEFSDFMLLDLPNRVPTNLDGLNADGECKRMLFNDPFLGIADPYAAKQGYTPYGEYAKKLQETGKKMGEYAYLFRDLSKLCAFMDIKQDVGLKARKAYKEGDKKGLKDLAKQLGVAVKRLDEFYEEFKARWMKDNKPFGFEVQDIRIGGMRARLLHCKERIEKYLKGKIDAIPELEEKILEKDIGFTVYREYITPGIM